MELSNRNLYHKHDQLMRMKKETYERIYNSCKNTIMMTANAGELICFFKIPSFLFGSSYPLINVKSCADYIIDKLTKTNNRIKAIFIKPNIIFINWIKDAEL
jgi:hypothetical protein